MVAVTLKLWADQRTDGERSCCSPEAVLGARAARAFARDPASDPRPGATSSAAGVVSPFLRGYAEGRTPNPCVLCNGELRIDAMIALADRLGAERLVTGHYARIADDGSGPLLAGAADGAKDQTYMLSALRPASLARLRFPLADLTKPEVREIAAGADLEVPAAPRARTSASSPGRASATSCAATPGSRTGRARSSIAPAAASASTPATTTSPSASGAGSAWGAASRSTCCGRTPPRTR